MKKPRKNAWKDKDIQLLKHLWLTKTQDRYLTRSEIAERMGKTKNAVSRKSIALRLPERIGELKHPKPLTKYDKLLIGLNEVLIKDHANRNFERTSLHRSMGICY